jgi:hypothetical protein
MRINEISRSLVRTNSAEVEENRVLTERGENKERVRKKKSVETINKQVSFYIKEGD